MKHPEIFVTGCCGRTSSRCALLAVTLVVAVSLGTATHADAQQPLIIDIGTLGGTTSEPRDVNDHGQVVGWSLTSGDVAAHAFSWTATGGMVDLGTIGTSSRDNSFAVAVNDKGQVVGQAAENRSGCVPPPPVPPGLPPQCFDVFIEHGFSWTATGGMVDLGEYMYPLAVNNAGQVFGYYSVSNFPIAGSEFHAFSWTESSGFVDLGLIGSAPQHHLLAASDSGDMVGWVNSSVGITSVDTAFWWSPTTGTVYLGTLGGTGSRAYAVSRSGDYVVGDSYLAADVASHGFVWTPTGGMVDLGAIAGPHSQAIAASDTGQVVGRSFFVPGTDFNSHAVSWTAMGGMVDLGTIGGTHSSAAAVNVNGVVVGSSTTIPGSFAAVRAFSWTAGGGMIDLGALGDANSRATLVNNRGQVVGVSFPPHDPRTSETTLYRATVWVPPPPSTDGYFEIVSRNSGKCLDVYGASMDAAASVIQWVCHGGENQQWRLEPAGGGVFRIIARHSGQVLDVYGELLDDVTPIIQWPAHGGDNQAWTLEPASNGYVFIVARHSSKVLDVEFASPDDGARVIQYTVHGGANQQWLLRAVGSAAAPITTVSDREP